MSSGEKTYCSIQLQTMINNWGKELPQYRAQQQGLKIELRLKNQESEKMIYVNAEYIMWNAGLDESQAEIKIAGKNINNLRYADDITLRAENEELKNLLIRVKEESEKAGLKLNI